MTAMKERIFKQNKTRRQLVRFSVHKNVFFEYIDICQIFKILRKTRCSEYTNILLIPIYLYYSKYIYQHLCKSAVSFINLSISYMLACRVLLINIIKNFFILSNNTVVRYVGHCLSNIVSNRDLSLWRKIPTIGKGYINILFVNKI